MVVMAGAKLSVGMPVYNGAGHLRAALEGVLAQSFGDFELVICDNASTDQTEAICREAAGRDRRIRYCRNAENVGAAPNFNRVFELADPQAPYFKWVAHDDLMGETFFEKCVAILEREPETVVAFPKRSFILHDGSPCPPEGVEGTNGPLRDWSFDRLSYGQLLRVSGLHLPIFDFGVIRAAALRKTRRLQSFAAADHVLMAELRLQGRFREVPEALYVQRLHPMTAEWKQRRSAEGQAEWFDPANKGKKQPNPALNLLKEQWRAIGHVPLGPLERWGRYGQMGLFVAGKMLRRLNPWHMAARAAERRAFAAAQAA
jgi:glycosyltransferase involved in cell wall biosynthesis